MKLPLLKISLFALIAILVSTACHKDESNELAIGSIVFKIDGVSFESVGAAGVIDTSFDDVQFFIITGVKNTGLTRAQTIAIEFSHPDSLTIGETTYSFDENDWDCNGFDKICGGLEYADVYFLNPNSSKTYDSGLGNSAITFTSLDYQKGGSAKGTFSGTLNDGNGGTASLTDGEFYVMIAE